MRANMKQKKRKKKEKNKRKKKKKKKEKKKKKPTIKISVTTGLMKTDVMYFFLYRAVTLILSTTSLNEHAYRWFRTTWLGTGRTELSSFEGTLLRMTFSKCGGNPGGGSFEMEEVESNIFEEEEEALEG